MALAPQLVGRVGCVVDLSAAFRLKDAALYPQWYGFEHDQPELLAEAVYGLPERHRADLKGARLVATPGCYVTAATLALAPLLDAGLVEPAGLIVDAASGVSGAGRAATRRPTPSAPSTRTSSPTACSTTATPPRSSRTSSAQVLFTPHLAPMNRGILATCYARPAAGADAVDGRRCSATLRAAYADEPFVVVIDGSPSTKATLGSNTAHVTARYDERTGSVVALVRPRQPHQGRLRRRAAVGQRRPRPRRDRSASRSSASPRDRPIEYVLRASPQHALGWPQHSDGSSRDVRRPRPRRGAAVHPPLRRQDGRRQVRRQRPRRHVRARRPRPVRPGHRADAPRRHAPGRRPRRRPADQRADGPPRQDAPSSATACGSPTPRPSTSPAWCSSARSTRSSSRRSTCTATTPSASAARTPG